MRYNKIKTLFIFLILVFTAVQLGAEGNIKGKDARLSKTAGSPSRTHFNINNVSTWIYNNGNSDIKPDGNSGFIFPKGSNLAALFQSGFVWGASVDGELRVGGSTYSQGLLPGRVLPNGQREVGVEGDKVRIFRVRTDYAGGDLSAEVADGEGTADEVRAQYAKDWSEWPAEYGAPYEDVDANGSYSADVDIPGFPGADQTIWFVANDLDTSTCRSLYGSDPMGIEMQGTYWGYKSSSALGNTMFRKFKIINKSATTFEDMYVSMWSDPDVGDAGDDLSGCDVEKSLMFTYNGDNDDATYGATPPAVGFDFFQGPIVSAPGEEAIFNNEVKPDFKNLPMSVHYFFINGDDVYADPDLGEYVTGTLQFHNLFRGLISTSGSPFLDPFTGEQTKFTLSGDPITGQGWVDGIQHPADDRRQGMVAGPFDMPPGDVQEVVVATVAAGAFGVVDRLGAVQLLKFYDQEAQSAYDNFFQIPKSPSAPTITISELDEEVIITWDDATSEEIEAYDDLGYAFQGYVVYQYPSRTAPFEDAKLVKTYDLIDGIAKVIGPQFDIAGGVVLDKVLKFGTDEGIKRSISLKSDLFNGSAPLNNGTPYYYAVTSYVVNKDLAVVPNILESELLVKEVVPQNMKPGEVIEGKYGEGLDIVHNGTANSTVSVLVANPIAVTGDDYELFFDQQHYYLAKDGIWKETAYEDSVGKSLNKPGDQGPSTLVPLVSIFAPNQTLDVHFMVENNAPDFNYIDAVSITFPAGIVINSANNISSNHDASPEIDGQTVTWGTPGDLSTDGPFTGGEDIMVNIDFAEPTFTVDYVIYDDGWSESYAATDSQYFLAGNGTVDGVGSVTLSGETGFQFKTEQHWNVMNTTTNAVVLDDQRVFGGTNVYTQENVGADAAKMFEGLTATVVGSFEAPITYLATEFTVDADPSDGDLSLWGDLQLFGDPTGFWFEEGSTSTVPSIEAAQPDLEFRFTGVADNNDAPVTAGGQWTTQWERGAFGANDMTGLNSVQIRAPFEVWDIENNVQLEVVVINRNADGTAPYLNDVGAEGVARWRITGRDYIIILNKPYTDDPTLRRDLNDESATWCVFFTQAGGSVWSPGDVYTIFYANPLQLGVDSFTFKAPAFGYDATQAAKDVKEVNVFPNPYYGVNPNEINKYQRFVTFNHLPPTATIRLFNLGGQLVKTIEKQDQSQFQKWDLTNETGLPIASGVYIAYIDMPELGKTKILKVAIIQETQILDRF